MLVGRDIGWPESPHNILLWYGVIFLSPMSAHVGIFVMILSTRHRKHLQRIVTCRYSTIAYVPQHPWLLNATVRDNILFGEPFRPKRFDRILKVCALKPDIELMPDGDMSEIGERGIKLSGGQRQRIVMARAFYSAANVVIMVGIGHYWQRLKRKRFRDCLLVCANGWNLPPSSEIRCCKTVTIFFIKCKTV